jgi:hypothetical protein
MEERRGVYRIVVGNLRERNRMENPGIDRMIILRMEKAPAYIRVISKLSSLLYIFVEFCLEYWN